MNPSHTLAGDQPEPNSLEGAGSPAPGRQPVKQAPAGSGDHDPGAAGYRVAGQTKAI